MSWYAHDEKDLDYEDTNGITAAEMAIVLDELANMNVVVKNHRDVADWRSGLTIDAATTDGSFQHDGWDSWRGEGIWRKMKWLDAAQIGGIKRAGS